MIRCIACKVLKEPNEFHGHVKKSNGKQSSCKECNRARDQKKYLRNRDAILAKTKQRWSVGKNFMDQVKAEVGCSICDERRVPCLEFHHEYPEDKSFTLGNAAMKPKEALIKEMNKCIVLCSNCHNWLHFEESTL